MSFIPPVGLAAGFHNAKDREPKLDFSKLVPIPKEHSIHIGVTVDERKDINGGKPFAFGLDSPIFSDTMSPVEYDLMVKKLLQEMEKMFNLIKRELISKT